MKLKFKQQPFQAEAARCVVRAFQGQSAHEGFVYIKDRGKQKEENSLFPEAVGFGNAPLSLQPSDIAENVRSIQIEQGLKPIEHLEGEGGIYLTVEMETGTGKTYTYIKTMYELNREYGWSKFIVVVPSVAIREGVYKSFETMSDHFAREYDGKRISYFIYNSKQLGKIDTFANSNSLQVMIINMQAFNTSFNEQKNKEGRAGDATARIIFDERDDFGSRRPIDVLAKTQPIVIIDEPQSVLGKSASNATREGLKLFNPLFTLLYSATHREVMNMVYRLDAIDAYNQKLVKKIEVKGIRQIGNTATNGYLYLNEIVVQKGKNPQARLSFDSLSSSGEVRQITRLVGEGFNLNEQSGGIAEYEQNYIVSSIDGRERTVTFLNGLELQEGDTLGEVTEDSMRRIQIRETIKSHIERERSLYPKGIKVLSLFFIDHVENYRVYEEGATRKGKFATMFEEEYQSVLNETQDLVMDEAYREYLNGISPEHTHAGYFSQDKKGRIVDSTTKRGETAANDPDAYQLIMRDKERLLSFDEPTHFIFSHSALKEGWDNPNVFQICTLKNTANEIGKRQEVGRGMRLCVNQKGERQDVDVLGRGVFDVNILTVIASESYEQFSKQLQHEISELVDNVVDSKKINIDDARRAKEATFDEERFKQAQFQELWKRINVKTYYKVDFDSSELIRKASEAIDDRLRVTAVRMVVEKGQLEEIESKEQLKAAIAMSQALQAKSYDVRESVGSGVKYDLIGRLVTETGLTRKTIVKVLKGIPSEKFDQFKQNPEEFIRKVANIINDEKANAVVENICYVCTENRYGVDIFTESTLRGKEGDNAIRSVKSLYDLVVVDSEGIEKRFAEALEAHEEVVVYTKLPRAFYINTPMGHYTPDWAIVFNEGTVKHIYFVAETKGSENEQQRRAIENSKITCAEKHFDTIADNKLKFCVVTSYKELYDIVRE